MGKIKFNIDLGAKKKEKEKAKRELGIFQDIRETLSSSIRPDAGGRLEAIADSIETSIGAGDLTSEKGIGLFTSLEKALRDQETDRSKITTPDLKSTIESIRAQTQANLLEKTTRGQRSIGFLQNIIPGVQPIERGIRDLEEAGQERISQLREKQIEQFIGTESPEVTKPADTEFKVGDTRVIGGILYKRNAKGRWIAQ